MPEGDEMFILMFKRSLAPAWCGRLRWAGLSWGCMGSRGSWAALLGTGLGANTSELCSLKAKLEKQQ